MTELEQVIADIMKTKSEVERLYIAHGKFDDSHTPQPIADALKKLIALGKVLGMLLTLDQNKTLLKTLRMASNSPMAQSQIQAMIKDSDEEKR